MKATSKSLLIFCVLAIIYLLGTLLNWQDATFYLKPVLLIPLMIASLILTDFPNRKILFLALVFSWVGDTFLLFVFRNGTFFIFGLIAFLIAHIFYVILFVKELKKAGGKFTFAKPGLFIIILYLAAFLWPLFPYLYDLKIPVIIYSLVITSMLYTAYLLAPHLPKPSAVLLLSGAVSFVVSDSILGINKFYVTVPYGGSLIMVTYLYAQGALVWACIKGSATYNATETVYKTDMP
ncbi:MAG: lysoplasmalogenase [Ginsengibacter sp.]